MSKRRLHADQLETGITKANKTISAKTGAIFVYICAKPLVLDRTTNFCGKN